MASEEPLKETMAELSKKLGLFESVRDVCHAVQIPLPGVVVVGEQSAGKSSLLENISGIQFPRAQNTCTRMPCVLTLLTDQSVTESHALVSMNSSPAEVEQCKVEEVEEKIRMLTEKHATKEEFISRKAMFIRVIRPSGPQLSLIDLPGVTHNADKMANIHEVTVALVEEYIKPLEMVILCVIPAMSDFGNAEVVKLARKYDPDGIRTLGVVTKCDDAANAEASDIVEKVTMARESDVKLQLGFHCVVNRSQKNIDDGMTRGELWNKEEKAFNEGCLRDIPRKNCGTFGLMEKVAKIQEARVDECLPKIKEAVRTKMDDLRKQLRSLPTMAESEADQFKLFNNTLVSIREDLGRRARAEFMSNEEADEALTIAPRVSSMIQDFRDYLVDENPDWLGEVMIENVDSTVTKFSKGYTVPNLLGPQVFISLVQRVFIEEGLLRDSVNDLVTNVGEHLRKVVHHVVSNHANINVALCHRLSDLADDCIDLLKSKALLHCEACAEAQAVTNTTQGRYMVKLTKFRQSWFLDQADQMKSTITKALLGTGDSGNTNEEKLTPEFMAMVQNAQSEPDKLAVLEICASLHVYTESLIENFVEMSAKLVMYNMVDQLGKKLEEQWRDECGSNLAELFPKDKDIECAQHDLEGMIEKLRAFKEQLSKLKIHAAAPARQLKTTKAHAKEAEAAKEEAAKAAKAAEEAAAAKEAEAKAKKEAAKAAKVAEQAAAKAAKDAETKAAQEAMEAAQAAKAAEAQHNKIAQNGTS